MSGDEHGRERKLLMPPFHGERMRAYGKIMREVTSRQAEKIVVGKQFRALELTTEISLEVIIRAVFGVELRWVDS